jgi:hypothetical protein
MPTQGKKISNTQLLQKLGSIKRQSEWIRAAETLGFRISNGGKHPYVIRDPVNPSNSDFRSSVTTIPSHLHKVMNERIFLQILNSPISTRMNITEDMIWAALNIT